MRSYFSYVYLVLLELQPVFVSPPTLDILQKKKKKSGGNNIEHADWTEDPVVCVTASKPARNYSLNPESQKNVVSNHDVFHQIFHFFPLCLSF